MVSDNPYLHRPTGGCNCVQCQGYRGSAADLVRDDLRTLADAYTRVSSGSIIGPQYTSIRAEWADPPPPPGWFLRLCNGYVTVLKTLTMALVLCALVGGSGWVAWKAVSWWWGLDWIAMSAVAVALFTVVALCYADNWDG